MFFHNGKGYDSHFIINEIANFQEIEKINIIPKTEEKFICYDFNDLKFLDTISFMNPDDSLDKLFKSLKIMMNMIQVNLKYQKNILIILVKMILN